MTDNHNNDDGKEPRDKSDREGSGKPTDPRQKNPYSPQSGNYSDGLTGSGSGSSSYGATLTPVPAVTPTDKALPAMGNRSRGVAALMGAIRAAMGSLPVATANRAVMGNHLEAIVPMGVRILPPLAPRPDSPVPRIAAMVSRLTHQINPRIAVAITVLPGHMANRSRGAVAPTGSNHGKTIPVAITNRKKP